MDFAVKDRLRNHENCLHVQPGIVYSESTWMRDEILILLVSWPVEPRVLGRESVALFSSSCKPNIIITTSKVSSSIRILNCDEKLHKTFMTFGR